MLVLYGSASLARRTQVSRLMCRRWRHPRFARRTPRGWDADRTSGRRERAML